LAHCVSDAKQNLAHLIVAEVARLWIFPVKPNSGEFGITTAI